MALRLGFIGCGGIARHHARQLVGIDGAQIVAGADINRDAARSFADDFGVKKAYGSYRSLLKSREVDAVLVCLPTYLHKPAVIAAAKAGKHVFTEKPMAMKVRDADRMIAACREAGVLLTVGFVRQFDNDWGAMRKLVTSGAIGRPVIWQSCSAGSGPAIAWFNDAKMGGGPLIDGAVHNYNFAISMFGLGTDVQAASYTWNPANTGQDTVSAIIRFESGDQLLMSWSWGMRRGIATGGLHQVIGPEGAISWGVPDELLPETFDKETQGALLVSKPDGVREAAVFQKNNMFGDQMRHVVACFSAGTQPKVTGEHGRTSLAVAEAVLKSAPKRRAVTVVR